MSAFKPRTSVPSLVVLAVVPAVVGLAASHGFRNAPLAVTALGTLLVLFLIVFLTEIFGRVPTHKRRRGR